MKKLVSVLAVAGAFSLVASNALAWGNDGHRVVGAIADKLIKGTAAEKQVAALLLPGESLESIANWADCVKGSYCGPQTPEMVAYVNANPKASEYHYTDVPFQKAHYHDNDVGTSPDDIVQTLKEAIAVLQGKDGPAVNPHGFTRRQALLLLTHMTGDIHQPLHVGAAYVGTDGKFVVPNKHTDIDAIAIFDSRGGNNFLMDDDKVSAMGASQIPGENPKPRDGVPKALTKPFHSYWDSTSVDYAMRRSSTRTPEKFAQWAIDSKPVVDVNTGDLASWPYQWADDSLVAAKAAYADVTIGPPLKQTSKKGDVYYNWNLEVPTNYPVPSSALARTQLIKGGYHLAAILQAIWPAK
jgi:hypothetical protein